MARLLSIILNLLQLLKRQGCHTPGPVSDQSNAEDSSAQLQLIHTALKQIHADSEADRALKNEELRLDRKRLCIEGWTLAFFVVGAFGTLVNLWLLKSSMTLTEQQLLASRRPWVSVGISLTADIEPDGQGYSVKVKYTTHNHGTTPAVGVYIHPHIVLATPAVDLDGEQNKVCELGMDRTKFSMGGTTSFPPKTTRHLSLTGLLSLSSTNPLRFTDRY